MNITQTGNNSNVFVLSNKRKETINERFAKESKAGITVAGITSKLEKIYINLLLVSDESILLILI